ncbi:MAG TPA: hotdog fold thioesterase [Acidimicrobiia bacterium]|nr:hotdog fold thioesterase [Acidimicrobiia bacterium]
MNDPAARVRELFGRDRYAARLGMQLIDDDPHHIVVDMPVTQDHENFYDVTHGGAMFSLADCAFALASNAAGDRAVAIDTHLVLTAGTRRGDVLSAVAEEATRGRRLGTYRITVTRRDGRVCGLFTGTVHITPAS